MTIDELLSLGPVIPVIVIQDARQAAPLAKALVEGGVRVLEVTLRTEAALEAIERTPAKFRALLSAWAPITDPKQFGAARQAGLASQSRPA